MLKCESVRRIPFTLALALTILATTTVTGTLLRAIHAPELIRWGVSAADLAHGRWFHLFLATFQILDPYLALSMLATVLALVGACEYRLGTARTVLVRVRRRGDRHRLGLRAGRLPWHPAIGAI